MLEHVMTIEPRPTRPPCDLISKNPQLLPISRLHGRNPLVETRGNWIFDGLRGLQGMLDGAGGTTNYFLSLHILCAEIQPIIACKYKDPCVPKLVITPTLRKPVG